MLFGYPIQQLAFVVAAMALLATFTSSITFAQTIANASPASESSDNAAVLAEVVVTAEKKSESLQQAPAAISVLSSADLVDRQVLDIRGVDSLVPSVKTNKEGTATQIFIRGVGKQVDQGRIPDAVGMLFDGILVPQHATALSLFDVHSIEVLPGPQGTLYGSSAIGGVVSVVNNRPTQVGETALSFETGDYWLRHVTAVTNAPINSDWSIRAAFNGVYHDGYNSNGTYNDNVSAMRLSSLYAPSDQFSLLLSATYSVDHFRPAAATYHPYPYGNAYTIPPYDSQTALFYPPNGGPNDTSHGTLEVSTLGAHLDWTLGPVTLSYIPGYLRQANPGDNVNIVAGFLERYHSDIDQYSNELRLANSSSHSRLQWLAGVYQLYRRTYETDTFGPNLGGWYNLDQMRSYAVFGQTTWSFTGQTRITLGARASRDSLSAANAQAVYPVLPDFSRGAVTFNFADAWEKGGWKVGMEHDLTSNSMLYGNVQSGFNPGTFDGNLPTPDRAVHPQAMIGYTLGIKNTFLNSRLKVNLEGFLYDYRDQIILVPNLSTGVSVLYNAPRSRLAGAQMDSAFSITQDTRLYANVGYLDAKFRNFTASSPATGEPVDFSGYQLPFAPSLTATVGLEHVFELGDRGSITARADSYISSSYWIVFDHTPGLQQPSYTRTDASLTYRSPNEMWEVGLWGKNLENKAVLSTGGETGRPYPYEGAVYVDPPRTYGVRFSVKFKH